MHLCHTSDQSGEPPATRNQGSKAGSLLPITVRPRIGSILSATASRLHAWLTTHLRALNARPICMLLQIRNIVSLKMIVHADMNANKSHQIAKLSRHRMLITALFAFCCAYVYVSRIRRA
eukprot:scaffold3016_cov415-Prasinococcus_capsulatus_cf.AAC.4